MEVVKVFMLMTHRQIILFPCSFCLLAGAMAPTHLLVTRAGPCSETTPITISELSVITQPNASLLSGALNVSEDIEDGWNVKATMQKCVDIRNLASCDFFRSFYLVNDGCSDAENEQKSYDRMLFHYTKPKLECPVKAGRYKLTHYPVFTKDNYMVVSESKISTSIFGYTFRLDGFSEKRRKIFCVEALLQLMYTRKHNWAETTHTEHISPVSEEREKMEIQD